LQHLPLAARDLSLDLARALAVAAMVVGHTLDTLLSMEARAGEGMQYYWRLRGLTAPMFLLVSGWAVYTAVTSHRARGFAIVRGRLPRVLLLLALGYLLRLPTWGWDRLMAGDEAVWRHFLGFDALHCVGIGLLVGALVLALVEDAALRALAFGALGLAAFMAGGPAWAALSEAPLWIRQSVGGGTAQFPVLPWIGWFCFGAMLGALRPQRVPPLPRAAAFLAIGTALVAYGWQANFVNLPQVSAELLSWRAGMLLVLLALVALMPQGFGRAALPLGRASLGIYLVHIPMLYGWGTWPGLYKKIGQTQPFCVAFVAGLAMLAASYGVVLAWRRGRTFVEERVAELRRRLADRRARVAEDSSS
jgi:acyltransferase